MTDLIDESSSSNKPKRVGAYADDIIVAVLTAADSEEIKKYVITKLIQFRDQA